MKLSTCFLVGVFTLGVFGSISLEIFKKGETVVDDKEDSTKETSPRAREGRKDGEQWSFYTPGDSSQSLYNSEQFPAVLTNEETLENEERATNAARMWQSVRSGDATAIRDLVEQGVDIDESDNEDLTPLHYAAYQGQVAMTQQLLDCGAGINAQDIYGYTPLMLATRSGKTEIVKLLLMRGADPNVEAVDNTTEGLNSKTTALKIAILNNYPEIIELLQKKDSPP